MHEQTHFNEVADEVDQKVFEAVGLVNSGAAIDEDGKLTPINEAKIRLAKRLSADGVIHNSLVTCNRSGGSFFSPLKERGYKGDSAIDAKEYSLITGDKMTEEQFHDVGLRVFNLMRACTIRSMGTKNMRAGHDQFPDSAFDHPDWKDKPGFTPGIERMDRADMDKALDMYYAAMGWDKNGAPTKETLKQLGLDDVADQLDKQSLI
jgi:aldehyde:ferredoxin oxidoreductase